MTKLIPLSSVCAQDVEILLDAAFGADRYQRTAYLLRKGVAANDRLSFACVDEDRLVGSIQCWPVMVASSPLILVGPVAVSPDRQNQGIGHMLMHSTLRALTIVDPPMVMVGDEEYYERFGFVAEQTGGWTLPGPWEPHRLLLRNPQAILLPTTGLLAPRL